MKILYILNIPSPYRVAYLEELGKHCDLTVLFEKAASDERDSLWSDYSFKNFKGIIMRGMKIRVDSSFCPSVIRYLKKDVYDAIICGNVASFTGMLAIQYMRWKKIPYWLEADGAYAGSGKGIKESIKKHFIRDATGYFSTADETDGYFLMYGAKKERIYRYPFTSIYAKDIFPYVSSAEEKRSLREKWNVTEEKVILAVGPFVHRKGFDLLIPVAKDLCENTGIYIIGGAPTPEYEELVRNNNNIGAKIHFCGFKNKQELREFYRLSDVFCLPTREDIWGLVINEAMACGLPVVTTKRCIAGSVLVKDGENGYLVDVDDEKQLTDALKNILSDDNVIHSAGRHSIRRIQDYTLENMASTHIAILASNT